MALRKSFKQPVPSKGDKNIITKPSSKSIRLIGDKGEQLGILTVREGLDLATEKGLDLVEVAPHLDPPTCKLMDWGRYQYRINKKTGKKPNKSSKKRKEIQLRPKIEKHDLETKFRHAKRFLETGHKVLVSLIFRGRELRYVDDNSVVIEEFVKNLEEFAKIERELKREGRNRITIILGPK